jgi:hypothetical protein
MGQAKNRGTREERIALAQAWEEAHAEKGRREQPFVPGRHVHTPTLNRIALLAMAAGLR